MLPRMFIAEFKRRSPFAGAIHEDADLKTFIQTYMYAEVDMISILCDEEFGGSWEDLTLAAQTVNDEIPLLAKGVFMDPLDVQMAAKCGASAILLFGDEPMYNTLAMQAHLLGLCVLAECRTLTEVQTCRWSSAPWAIGVNARGFAIDRETIDTERHELLRYVPKPTLRIAESGLLTPEDVEKTMLDADGVLVGTALMQAEDVYDTCLAMKQAMLNV